MRHNLKTVAQNFRLPSRELIEFARKNPTKYKYGIVEEGKLITTSTLFTDLLVHDFREELTV